MICLMCKNQMEENSKHESFECCECEIVCFALWPQFENQWRFFDWNPTNQMIFEKFEEVVRQKKLLAFD